MPCQVPSAIAPFSNDGPVNWQLASTSLDTTPYGARYLTFWVVTWMTDAAGNRIQEMPGHGLTRLPGALNSLADAAALSESYGNNIGFYKLALYVLPPSSATGSVTAAAPDKPIIRLGKVRVSSVKTRLGRPVRVKLRISNRGTAIPGLTVNFYTGDPAQGGKLFDIERLSYLPARSVHQAAVTFHAGQCSRERLYVTVGAGGPHAQTVKSAPIRVVCSPRLQCAMPMQEVGGFDPG